MTAEVIKQAQQLLDSGHSKSDVAQQLGVRYDTLRKALEHGRLVSPSVVQVLKDESGLTPGPSPTVACPPAVVRLPAIDKSTRSDQDQAAGEQMGIACTRPVERVLASLGKLPAGASTQFEPCRDLSSGGVLCALPALAENGLFRHLQSTFPTLTGYYTSLHVVLLLASMALCRIRTVEQLQFESPGELGKLLGLDRVPDVRCLRKKLGQLSRGQDSKAPDKDEKFERLAPSRKRLTDTVKLIAYRSETAMSSRLRESLAREDDSRSLLRDLFRSDADLIPDHASRELEVRLHTLANPRSNRAIRHLLDHLNNAECTYPGTDFRLR